MRPSDEAGVTRLIQHFFFPFNVGRLPPIQYHTFANLQEQAVSAFVSPLPVFIFRPFSSSIAARLSAVLPKKRKNKTPKLLDHKLLKCNDLSPSLSLSWS